MIIGAWHSTQGWNSKITKSGAFPDECHFVLDINNLTSTSITCGCLKVGIICAQKTKSF
jgi:hypothetical protein